MARGHLASAETACALLPVTVVAPRLTPPEAAPAHASAGVIELRVCKARLRLEGAVNAVVLDLVLQRLLAR